MISGTVYGIALNDRAQMESRMQDFHGSPYGRPPVAPVLYIKPRTCVVSSGSEVRIPFGMPAVEVAATIALLFGDAPGRPVAAALALEISEPHANFYRPAIKQRCRDGFLPVAEFASWSPELLAGEVTTRIDSVDVHRWSPLRLLRKPIDLIDELREYMTLADGDVLLIGLPGDAPQVSTSATVEVAASGLATLRARLVRDLAS